MKKAILIFTTLTLGLSVKGFSQDKYVVSANVALNQGNLDEAKENIDKAMQSPETSEKPKALWSKAQIYFSLMGSPKYKDSQPYKEATMTAIKLAEIKPDYEKASVDQVLIAGGYLYFNDGVKAYNNKDNANRYANATEDMKVVLKIRNLNGGKRFEKFERIKSVDTVAANASMIIANCAYFSNKYDEAIPLLIEAKNNPITKSAALYENLIDAYEKTKHTAEEAATIKEARAAFPDNETLRNFELNYYITSGKQDDLTKKLEEEAAKDPKNAELQISLATAYAGMANPKTGSAPANKEELLAKAETAYQNAVNLAPDNAEYNYFYGVLYYNQAKDINDQMNAITGTSDADLKKYDDLKMKRDGNFNKALPNIEKAYQLFDAKAGALKPNEKPIYIGSMQALTQIYAIQSKMDKVEELKKKMAAAKQ